MNSRSVSFNTLLNAGGQLLPLLVAIFSVPALIRGLGVDRFGLLTLAWLVIGYFTLFDLGFGRALTQLVSERLGKQREEDLNDLVRTAILILTGMGLLGGACALLATPWLSTSVFKIPLQLQSESSIVFPLLAVSVPVVVLASGLNGILIAHQRFDLINYVRVPLGISNYLLPLLALTFSQSLVPVTLFMLASRLLSTVVLYRMCTHLMPGLARLEAISWTMARPLLSFGGWMTITNIVSPLMVYLDRMLIGVLVSVSAVAYYSTPFEMVTKLFIISGSLCTTLFPAFASSFAGDLPRVTRLLDAGWRSCYLVLYPLVLILIAFSREGIGFWLGPDFASHSSSIFQWLAAGVFINSLAQVIFTLIQGAGRPDLSAKLHLIEFAIYLPCLWLVLRSGGIVGVAILWTARIAFDAVCMGFILNWLSPPQRPVLIKILGASAAGSLGFLIAAETTSIAIRLLIVGVGLLGLIVSMRSSIQMLWMDIGRGRWGALAGADRAQQDQNGRHR